LTADSVASPRLVYGGLDLSAPEGSNELGRVTFEGLDAVRASRGEYLPFDVFHDEFAEAIAAGIWLDLADRANPFAPPGSHLGEVAKRRRGMGR